MAGRWMDLGHYRARGVPGADALGLGIERMLTGIQSPVETERGLAARLRYLTASDAGYQAMDRAGLAISRRTLMAWLAEERTPRGPNLARIDSAYWDLRRYNVAADFKRRLNNNGRGTRIEIDPVDQTQVDPRHRRDLNTRHMSVRGVWDAAVDAWVSDDTTTLDAIWDEIIADIGTDYDSYSNVSSVGWAA
jgi:hypothetical protein